MYWTQDESADRMPATDEVVDLLFPIDCRRLPVDHAYALGEALCRALPWLAADTEVAVHEIHVAGSQNGWERPAHGTRSYLRPSRRTRLAIRAPKDRIEPLLTQLSGTALSVDDCALSIGPGKIRPLSAETTLFARHVVGAPREDEETFLARCAQALSGMDIRVRKALCGRSVELATPEGAVFTRGLMLADLTRAESIRLQQSGLGPRRLLGCGIFIPHKGIDPVAPLA
jgi:CRISPR-associated protein Cas6